MCSSWNPNQLLTKSIHLIGKILSLQVTCKKNKCLARLCFDILQVVHELARILQGFYCLSRNLQEIYSSQETCTILARVVFFSTRDLLIVSKAVHSPVLCVCAYVVPSVFILCFSLLFRGRSVGHASFSLTSSIFGSSKLSFFVSFYQFLAIGGLRYNLPMQLFAVVRKKTMKKFMKEMALVSSLVFRYMLTKCSSESLTDSNLGGCSPVS